MQQRKIGKSADLDLQISNPQTGEGIYWVLIWFQN
jgi:hypothetical protein